MSVNLLFSVEHLRSLPHQIHVLVVWIPSWQLSPELWNVVFHGSSHAVLSGLRITLSPWQLMVSSWLSLNLFGSSHCCCLQFLFSILEVKRSPFFLGPSSGLSSSLSVSCDQRQEVSVHSFWPSHSTRCPPAAARLHDMQVTDCSQTPCAAIGEHVGLLAYLEYRLALQKQSSNGELPALLHGSCSSLVKCWAQLAWPCSSLSPAACFGTGLACSSPFFPSSEISPSTECCLVLDYLFGFMKESALLFSEPEGVRRKDK